MTFNEPVLRQVLQLLAPPKPTEAEAAAEGLDSPFVCEKDLTKTDRSATCQHTECNPIRNAVCIQGRCQCAAGWCSDMSDPDPPLGVSIGGMNALPAATCISPNELHQIPLPELNRRIVERSGAVVSMSGLLRVTGRLAMASALVVMVRRMARGAPREQVKVD
uniref:Uncharacterized protein n=1 Tax=Calcidiscus leptoporus TaxID=127549 RepID=A0A7S0P1K7_9EUKA|eukprot:CAMPEP_0119381358 /NCGR_PEP_ID=MMETSP1334-20130426/63455_1 /TAXON_ID=127549 /ORGANISM="Calcidiscus leptoporus, Strain RCC1130" /LENGTH=162 /DNA_ID=CAMNT_0007401457 /DNA_START=46 /DNA_END=534 /DNA_ORIENTATION=+